MKRHILAAAVLAATTLAAQAAEQLDIPYEPADEAVSHVETTGIWAEAYPARGLEAAALVERLVHGQDPEQAVAILAGAKAFISVGGRQLVLPEVYVTMTRNGAEVEYDTETCLDYPKPGDELAASYAHPLGGYTLEVKGKVVRYVAQGYLSPLQEDPVDLDLSRPGHCSAVTSTRMFVQGRLELSRNGQRLDAHDVLVQSIVEYE